MGKLLTLIAAVGDTPVQAADLPAGFAMRPCRRSDTQSLGRLYYEAYEPGVAAATLDEAVADIRACFDGAYGDLWPAASLAIHRGDTLAAAILTVHRAPWDDTPGCPFIIELFTAPLFRRQGLARALVDRALAAAHHSGSPALALRVAPDNTAARALYASRGFGTWQTDGGTGASDPR